MPNPRPSENFLSYFFLHNGIIKFPTNCRSIRKLSLKILLKHFGKLVSLSLMSLLTDCFEKKKSFKKIFFQYFFHIMG